MGGPSPHTGASYASLGGSNNQTGTLSQTVAVPASAARASLTFWVNVTSQESSTTRAFDTMRVEVHRTSGSLLATPLTLDNRDSARDGNQAGVYFQPPAADLSRFRGQTIVLTLHATDDFELPTTFLVDDVSISTA